VKLAYQVSTPDVLPSPGVTAFQSDLETAFRRLREVGYDGAELMVNNPACVDASLVKQLAEQYKLDVPMICTGEIFGQDKLTFSSPDDKIRSEALGRVKSAVDLAAVFGAQVNIGRVRGGHIPGVPQETTYARAFDALCDVSDYAAGKKVTVALEPVNTLAINFINSTPDGLNMMQKVGRKNFTIMLDSAHMFIEDPDMEAAILAAKGCFSYVHLCDSNRKYPGNCKINFASFIDALRKTGYTGYVSIEVFQIPDQETALRKSYEYIKPLLPE